MKHLYCCLLLLINVYAMEDLDDLVPDFMPVEAKKESFSLVPEKDRIMANLPLMELPFDKDARQRKKINYNEDSVSDPEISLQQTSVATRIACVLCNKTFARKDSLLVHQRTKHEESEKIPCMVPKCLKTFVNKSHHDTHIKKFHKLHPKSLKPWSENKAKQNPRSYQTNKYQSLATLNAKRMSTRKTP